jgi:intracellular multiplication protein IcmL
VQAAYSFDYLNYRSQMQNAQKYFTSYGWTTYVRALRLSGNLSAVTDAKRIAMARVVEAPKLLAEGLLGGSYAWKFQMPVLVTYFEPPYTDQTSFASAIKVTVLVQRQPPLQGYQGLGIMQFIAEMP